MTSRSRWLPALAVLAALAAAAALLPGFAAGAAEPKPPSLDARAWVLIDARSGDRLAAKAPGKRLPIASTTKLMTARLVLADLPLDRKIPAADYDPVPAESVLGLEAGEMLTVRDLLIALMLPSANDAAVTLAEGVAGSTDAFVVEMNREAKRLGLADTSYANPIGLDDPDNYSTAADLGELATLLRQDRRFRRIVSKPEATLRSGSTTRTVTTRNGLLLADPSVDGIKTGHTLGAGYVLVGSAERGGVPLISVVIGAPSEASRDAESEQLLDYGFGLYTQRRVVRARQELGTIPIDGAEELPAVAAEGVKLKLRRDQRVETEIRPEPGLGAPIAIGEEVGRALVTVDGERVATIPALAAAAVDAPGLPGEAGAPVAAILIGVGAILIAAALVVAAYRRRSTPVAAPATSQPRAERTPEERSRSQLQRAQRRDGS